MLDLYRKPKFIYTELMAHLLFKSITTVTVYQLFSLKF